MGLAFACGRLGFNSDAHDADTTDGVVGADATLEIDAYAGAPWIDGFARRKPVAIHPPSLTANLTEFPVAVRLNADPELAAAAQSDGGDLTFTTGDGTTQLSHQIEHFDGQTGTLAAWVRLPVFAASADTELFVYYDTPSVIDQQDIAGTWAGPFAGVWHLSDDPSSPRDSSVNSNHGSSDNPPVSVDGIAGLALDFDGIDDIVSFGDPGDGSLDFGTSSFSYSVWVRVTTSVGSFDMPWFKGGASPGQAGYDMELGTTSWSAHMADGTTIVSTSFGQEGNFLGRWVHLVVVADRQANVLTLYADAIPRADNSLASLGSLSNGTNASISRDAQPFRGRVDEVRVYSTALSQDWITAAYRNLVDLGFMTIGPEEQRPP